MSELSLKNMTMEEHQDLGHKYYCIMEAMELVWDKANNFKGKLNQLKYIDYAEKQILTILEREPRLMLAGPKDLMDRALKNGMFKIVEKGLDCKEIHEKEIFRGMNLASTCAYLNLSKLANKALETCAPEILTHQNKEHKGMTFGMYAAVFCEDESIYKRALELDGADRQRTTDYYNDSIESLAAKRDTYEFKEFISNKNRYDTTYGFFDFGKVDEKEKLMEECRDIDETLEVSPIEGFFDEKESEDKSKVVDLKSVLDFIYDGDKTNPEYIEFMDRINGVQTESVEQSESEPNM